MMKSYIKEYASEWFSSFFLSFFLSWLIVLGSIMLGMILSAFTAGDGFKEKINSFIPALITIFVSPSYLINEGFLSNEWLLLKLSGATLFIISFILCSFFYQPKTFSEN